MEIGFVASFAFCVIILLLILRFTKIHWVLKAGFTVLSLAVIFMFYTSLMKSLGWPLNYKPTATMLIEGIDVREPNTKFSGIIYLWYVDVDQALKTGIPGIPRAIHIPYNKEILKKLAQAQGQMAAGMPVYMKFGTGGETGPNGNTNNKYGKKADENAKSKGTIDQHENFNNGLLDFVKPPDLIPKKQGPD